MLRGGGWGFGSILLLHDRTPHPHPSGDLTTKTGYLNNVKVIRKNTNALLKKTTTNKVFDKNAWMSKNKHNRWKLKLPTNTR